jgi:hypothetical protein
MSWKHDPTGSYTHKWPTKALEEVIEKYGPRTSEDYRIKMNLKDCHPIDSEESREQLREFAPEVYGVGLELFLEKRRHWGGVLSRTLEDKDGHRRCLQYILIYTRQTGVVSLFWNILLPVLLSIWGVFVTLMLPSLLQPDNILSLFPILMLSFPFFPFFFVVFQHLEEFQEEKPFSLRSTTFLPILFFAELVFAISTTIALTLLLSIISVFTFVWLAERYGLLPSAHDMDYVPIFVYLIKGVRLGAGGPIELPLVRKDSPWSFDYAVWDSWHYNTGSTRNPLDMLRLRTGKRNKQDSPRDLEQPTGVFRVPLTTDNSWHSMYLGKPTTHWIHYLSFFLSLILSLLSIVNFDFVRAASNYLLGMGPIYLPLTLMILFYSTMRVGRYPFLLFDPADLKETESILTRYKLLQLWNLGYVTYPRLRRLQRRLVNRRLTQSGIYPEMDKEEKAEFDFKDIQRRSENRREPRFQIVHKMQEPFHREKGFFDSFRDEPEYLHHLYGELEEPRNHIW